MRKRTSPFWVVLITAVLLTGCASPDGRGFGASPQGADFDSGYPSESKSTHFLDGPVYMNLAEAAERADLVVTGTFDKPLERSDDATVNGYDEPGGMPVQIWSFTVDDVLKVNPEIVPDRNPRTIRIEQYDFTRMYSAEVSNVASEGARAILFLLSSRQPEPIYGVVGGGQAAILVTEDGTLRSAPNASEPLARQIEGLRDRAEFFEAMSG